MRGVNAVLGLLLCGLAQLCRTTERETPQRPHIVFILADDLGWNDVSFHGSPEIPTPNIDALGASGVILNRYYVHQLCSPTRASLLTGRYPLRMGMQHNVISSAQPYGLPLNETLLPQYLKQLGYATHIVGKWHLGFYANEFLPTHRGFDSHYGFVQACGDYFDHTYAGDGLDPKAWGLDFRRNDKILRTEFGQYSTELFTTEAENIIDQHDPTQPLFLYMAHQAVHSGNGGTSEPLEAPQRFIDKMSHIKNPARRMYAAMVAALDESVGNVTQALHRRGLLDNAIVIFSTDNGGPANGFDDNDANNWPLRGLKNTLWEGGVRGVSLLWSPLLEKSGYTSEHMLHVTDWLPTLLSVAGYDMTRLQGRDLDGFDQWDALSQNLTSRRSEVLHNIDPILNSLGIRSGDMKLIYDIDGNTKTYDGWYTPDMMPLANDSDPNKSKNENDLEISYSIPLLYNRRVVKDKIAESKKELDGNLKLRYKSSVISKMQNNSSGEKYQAAALPHYLNFFSEMQSSNRKVEKFNMRDELPFHGSQSQSGDVLKYTANAIPKSLFSLDLILSAVLRKNISNAPFLRSSLVNIDCGVEPSRNSTSDCLPAVRPCLFNVTADPCERHNLAGTQPDVVAFLLDRLEHYRAISVPPINKPVDDKGLPYHHNGFWVPWIKLGSDDAM